MATNLEHIFVPESVSSSNHTEQHHDENSGAWFGNGNSRKGQKVKMKIQRLTQSDVKKKKKKKILRRLSTFALLKNGSSALRQVEEHSEGESDGQKMMQFSPLSPARQEDFDRKSWDQCKVHLETVFASLRGKVSPGVGARLDHIACCIRRGDQHISQLTHLHQQHQQQQRRSTEGAMRHRDPFARPSTSNISINSSTAMHHQNGVRLSIDSAITFQNARNSNTSANTQRMSLTSFSSTPGSNASLVAPRPRRTPSFGRYGN